MVSDGGSRGRWRTSRSEESEEARRPFGGSANGPMIISVGQTPYLPDRDLERE